MYQSCLSGVSKKCGSGSKRIFAESTNVTTVAKDIRDAFQNLTVFLYPSYDVLCERNEVNIGALASGLISAIAAFRRMHICNEERIKSIQQEFMHLVNQLFKANNGKFCGAYLQITKTINDLVEACSSDERDDYPEVRKEAIKIFELLPHLFSQILSAKCESMQSIEQILGKSPETIVKFSQPDVNGCWVYSMDMMVLVDGSGSVRSEEFEKLLRFLKKIASHLDLKMHKVGVMQYSHFYFNRPLEKQPYLQTEINLGEYETTFEFDRAVERIRQQGYTTFTAHAIQKALSIDLRSSTRFRSKCTKKIIVVVTDGRAADSTFLRTICNGARTQGVTLFSVGVKHYNINQLRMIASGNWRSLDRVYIAPSYKDLLNRISSRLMDDISAILSQPASMKITR